ncbi:MAG: four helix bundle protein [Bacillota bacterium]
MFFKEVNIIAEKLKIYKKSEIVFNKIYPTLKNYSNSEKYSLCTEIKNAYLNLLKNIMLANKVKSKRKYYQNEIDGYLQYCKILNNLSYNQKEINEGFHDDVELKLSEIGRLLSGWIRSN